MYKIVKFNNHWSVRDKDDNRLSPWFRKKCQALSEKHNLEQEHSQEGFDFDEVEYFSDEPTEEKPAINFVSESCLDEFEPEVDPEIDPYLAPQENETLMDKVKGVFN